MVLTEPMVQMVLTEPMVQMVLTEPMVQMVLTETSCSVTDNDEGALITCTDGTSAQIFDGESAGVPSIADLSVVAPVDGWLPGRAGIELEAIVYNAGPAATDVTLTVTPDDRDILLNGWVVAEGVTIFCDTTASRGISCNIGTIEAGDNVEVVATAVRPDPTPGNVPITFSVEGDVTDPNTANNADTTIGYGQPPDEF